MTKPIFCALVAPVFIGTFSAFAVDVDVNIGGGRRGPPVVVETPPRTVVERVWVPDRVVERTERVQVDGPRYRKVEEQVLVEPGRIDHVEEKVIIRPEHVEREYVPPVVDRVKIGPIYVNRTIRDGYWRENVVSAEYKTIYREVQIPPKFQTVTRKVEVPPQYTDVVRREVIPGHWEERAITRPGTVVVEPERRSGIDIDLDFGKKRDRDRDRDRDRR